MTSLRTVLRIGLLAAALMLADRSSAKQPPSNAKQNTRFSKGYPMNAQQKAALTGVYQKLLQRGEVPATGACFIFVPLPCPRPETYQASKAFMLKACRMAAKEKAKVVIVRYLYGKDPAQPTGPYSYWWKEASNLPKVFEDFISSGTVKIIDSFPPEVMMGTPWLYVYRDGVSVAMGNIYGFAQNPDPILSELKHR